MKNNILSDKKIWWMNAGVDHLWNPSKSAILPNIKNQNNQHAVLRMEQLCFFIADKADIVIQTEPLHEIIQECLKQATFIIPETWIAQPIDNNIQANTSQRILCDNAMIEKIKLLKQCSNVVLAPYAITDLENKISQKTNCEMIGNYTEMINWLNSKVHARELAMELLLPITDGEICYTYEDFCVAISRLEKNDKVIVFKEAYGASGKGLYIVNTPQKLSLLKSLIKRREDQNELSPFLVETWYETTYNINYQIYIHKDGDVFFIPPKIQLLDGTVFMGCQFPVDRFLSKQEIDYLHNVGEKVGNALWKKEYYGLASIDAIMSKDRTIFPIIEINGRFSLSTYLSKIPSIFKRNYIYTSKYYTLKKPISLEHIWNKLRDYQYTKKVLSGIIPYSFSQATDLLEGRLFLLYISDNLEENELLINDVEFIIKKMGNDYQT